MMLLAWGLQKRELKLQSHVVGDHLAQFGYQDLLARRLEAVSMCHDILVIFPLTQTYRKNSESYDTTRTRANRICNLQIQYRVQNESIYLS
jgi:hypothetical protein